MGGEASRGRLLVRGPRRALTPSKQLSSVLVVEDDPDLAHVLTTMFERQGLTALAPRRAMRQSRSARRPTGPRHPRPRARGRRRFHCGRVDAAPQPPPPGSARRVHGKRPRRLSKRTASPRSHGVPHQGSSKPQGVRASGYQADRSVIAKPFDPMSLAEQIATLLDWQ